MARLRATSATSGLPVTVGGITLSAEDLGLVTSVAPFRGQTDAVREAIGGWPEPGRWVAVNGGRLVWSGRGQALAMRLQMTGDAAALADQSDAWFAFRLTGEGAEGVLARLCPVDLRARSFAVGRVARTLLEHIASIILRDEDGFVILAPRSMAGSARHAIARAMDQAAHAPRT